MKVVDSDATIMSQAKARLTPAPAATPLTAAITGFSRSSIEWMSLCPACNLVLPDTASISLKALRSPPAENAFPSPVKIITLTSSLSLIESKKLVSSSLISRPSAFLTSGRINVTIQTPLLISTSID